MRKNAYNSEKRRKIHRRRPGRINNKRGEEAARQHHHSRVNRAAEVQANQVGLPNGNKTIIGTHHNTPAILPSSAQFNSSPNCWPPNDHNKRNATQQIIPSLRSSHTGNISIIAGFSSLSSIVFSQIYFFTTYYLYRIGIKTPDATTHYYRASSRIAP